MTRRPPRLLVVDDDATLASVVAMMARAIFPDENDLDIQTHVSVDAAQAGLHSLGTDGPTVVISDHHLPPSATTGLDLLEDVRDRFPATKRVLMTGRERSELEPHVTLAGLDAFLPKPFTLRELRPLLVRLFDEAGREGPTHAAPR